MSLIVSTALEYLKELEETMRHDSNFRSEDIENCDRIAELLQELELNVKKLHEELEIQTIKSSVFRHKMTFFESDLKREIDENVKAARDSNMAVILELKEKLEKLTNSIEKLHKRDKELSEEINRMEPEKKSLETNHENIILELNEKMAHKASSQIKLNETRDYLRELNQSILELEEDMINLNEKLVKERAEARDVKIGLENEKYTTNSKAQEQEEQNEIKFREVLAIQKSVKESNTAVRVIFRENERLEQLNTDLLHEIENGTRQLESAQKELTRLITEGLRLTTLEAKTQQDYNDNKNNIIKQTKETHERTHQEQENLKVLKETQEKKREELKEIYEKYKELMRLIDIIKKSIDVMKTDVSQKYQEIAELEVKNVKIYEDLSSAQQSHSQIMDSLQREAEECKEQLAHDRSMRLKKQNEREAKLAEIETFNANLIIFQSAVSTYLQENKIQTDQLKKKEASLTESVEFNEKEIIRLEAELNKANSNYDLMKLTLEDQLDILEKEKSFYISENETFTKEINNLNPGYEELCKLFKETVKDYEDTRRKAITTKNRKTALENNIKKVKSQIADYELSREKLKRELTFQREEALNKMKENNQESIKLEDVILHTGVKLQTIKQENDKFINAIQVFETQFRNIDLMSLDEINTREALENEYNRLHRELINGWKSDEDIEKLFSTKDLDLIEKLNHLFSRTVERENKLSNIAGKLYKELEDMDNYLIKMIGKNENEDNQKIENKTE